VSGGNALAVGLTLVAGVAGTVQVAVMGRFGTRIGIVPAFAFATALTAAIGLVVLLAARRSLGAYAEAAHQPAWLWLGGLMGGIIVFTITLAAPRIGATATVAIFVFAQFVAAAVVDRYGLFGLDRIAITWPRVAGLALLGVGAALTLNK
jgi:bacterial/archaeal transporter family-2 protein